MIIHNSLPAAVEVIWFCAILLTLCLDLLCDFSLHENSAADFLRFFSPLGSQALSMCYLPLCESDNREES